MLTRIGHFARSAGGAALVMDCRPADRIKPRDADAFAVTRAACELVGWRYEVAGSPAPVVVGNVRWLSGYRHRATTCRTWLPLCRSRSRHRHR